MGTSKCRSFRTLFLRVFLITGFLLCLTHGSNQNATSNNSSTAPVLTEVDLHEVLFENYNPNIMPKRDTQRPISISIDMNMMSIDNMDEKRQTITIRAFLAVQWKDAFLQWNPEEYSNVTMINVKVSDIWTPDIALENTFDKPTELGQEGGNANIDHQGNVIMWPYNTYTVACKIYISNFPFDEQTCTYQFLSWTNPTSVLLLNNSSGNIDLNAYTESGEWELIRTRAIHRQKPYVHDFWDLLIFEFKLRRKALYHVMNVMVPVLCISLLNIVCFLLPSEGGERVTLSISIFLTLAVFLTIVNSNMPESSDEVAKFGIFVGLQLLGSALTIVLTTLSLYIFYRDDCRTIMSPFRLLVRISCITGSDKRKRQQNKYSNNIGTKHNGTNSSGSNNGATVVGNGGLLDSEHNGGVHTRESVEFGNPNKIEPTEDDIEVTWKIVSRAMDRICFVAAFCWHTILIVVLIGTIAAPR